MKINIIYKLLTNIFILGGDDMMAKTIEFKNMLEVKGYKLTLQRRFVLERILKNQGKHLSAEEIYEEARNRNFDIGVATVYRTLDLFEKVGILKHTSFQDGCKRYEIMSRDKKNKHYHLICKICGKIIDIYEDCIGNIREEIFLRKGFIITNEEINLFGICEKCASKMSNIKHV